jgi:hypothetical protein
MSKYEVKLVNIGEEVDNRIRELEIEVKDIRKANDNLTRANESYRQENIDLRKEQFGVEVAMLTKKVDDLEKENKDAINEGVYLRNENEGYLEEIKELKKSCHLNEVIELRKRNAFLEKLHSQHRYVFSEIPNTEENMKMVKLMKKHINKDRYTVRWRGQYLIDGEDWKKYTDGQPMNKSKCIRVYIDSKGDDTTEGFKESEVQTILDALDTHIDKCQEFVSTWEVEGETDDEDVTWNKQDVKKSMELLRYFTEMKVHLEESKLARAEICQPKKLSASK